MVIGAFSGLAIAGTFVAMMMTRGAEKELADSFGQELDRGKILVAVETDEILRQRQADEILEKEGGTQTALPNEPCE